MPEIPSSIDIYPQDEDNSRDIMARIRAEMLTNEAAVRAVIEGYEFSSPETKEHVADIIIYLSSKGVFDEPELRGIELVAVDTDARSMVAMEQFERNLLHRP